MIVQKSCADLQRSGKKKSVGQIATRSKLPCTVIISSSNGLLVRRLRGSGRNKRGEDSSDESEEDHSESDNSETDNGDDASDSVGERRSLNPDDPSETRRPGRHARTRAKVTLSYFTLVYADWRTRQR